MVGPEINFIAAGPLKISIGGPTRTVDNLTSTHDAGDAGVLQPGVREEEVDHAPELDPRSGIQQWYSLFAAVFLLHRQFIFQPISRQLNTSQKSLSMQLRMYKVF